MPDEKGNGKEKVIFYIITFVAVGLSLFQIYTSIFGTLLGYKQRMIHLTAELILAYLLYNRKGKERDKGFPLAAILVSLILLGSIIYVFANYSTIALRIGNPQAMDLMIGVIYIVLVLEGTRRTIGWPLVIITGVFIIYCFAGPHIPGMLGHRGVSATRLIDHMFMSTEGIFGSPLGTSATSIAIFVIFGAFLEITHGGDMFIDLAVAMTGKKAGGPAKAAVISSALMGTISGSSIANVVTTGTFTIPLMKKSGYSKEFAGAVEAVASTGGQIMPPVMGAAAFLMIDYTRQPYSAIMIAAIFPAVIYFLSVYVSVHLEARKRNLKGVDQRVDIKRLLLDRGLLLLPLFVIIGLLATGATPMKSAVWGIILLVILAMVKKTTRFNPMLMFTALKSAAIGLIPVAIACASAGIVSGIISLTGVGLKLASYIEIISHGNLFIALLLTMIACIILGMGLPTVATYVVLITIVGPVLTNMGVPVLAAHLFVFYFGVVADITPPVALAAYAAAGISGGNSFKTGLTATGIAAGGFLVPYVFVAAPQMLLNVEHGVLSGLLAVMPVFATAFVGVIMLNASVIGFLLRTCNLWERVILALGALSLIYPGVVTDVAGIICLISIVGFQLLTKNKKGMRSYEN